MFVPPETAKCYSPFLYLFELMVLARTVQITISVVKSHFLAWFYVPREREREKGSLSSLQRHCSKIPGLVVIHICKLFLVCYSYIIVI